MAKGFLTNILIKFLASVTSLIIDQECPLSECLPILKTLIGPFASV